METNVDKEVQHDNCDGVQIWKFLRKSTESHERVKKACTDRGSVRQRQTAPAAFGRTLAGGFWH